jgi:CelD/BcsL family acetyltransferase involved in cellulose biosynthesis
LIDWVLVRKQQWLVQSNLGNDWIRSRGCRDFLMAMSMRHDRTGGMAVMTLELDGMPIAANIVSIDRSRMAGCVTAFDPAWHQYAPGSLLTEDLTRWAFEHGLDFDFRNGAQSYKFNWTQRSGKVVGLQVATNPRGAIRILRRYVGRAVSHLRRALERRPGRPVTGAAEGVAASKR